MGLITETIQSSNLLVSDSNSISSDIVIETIQENETNIICTDGSSSSLFDKDGVIDGTIYRVLCMQDDMKALTYPDRVKNEFDLFLEYAEKKTAGTEYDSRFDQLDNYLGTIGVSDVVC